MDADKRTTSLLSKAFDRALAAIACGEDIILEPTLRAYVNDPENDMKVALLDTMLERSAREGRRVCRKDYLPLAWGGKVVLLQEKQAAGEPTPSSTTTVPDSSHHYSGVGHLPYAVVDSAAASCHPASCPFGAASVRPVEHDVGLRVGPLGR